MSASVPAPEHDPFDRPDDDRPDWLVGAEEGVASEQDRAGGPAPEVRLHRPAPAPVEGLVHGIEGTKPPAEIPGLPLASRPRPAPEPEKPKAWTAKGDSVPKLALVPAVRPAAAVAAEPERDPDDHDLLADPAVTLIGAEEADQARAPIQPLDEPWWMVLFERLATDRRLQLVIVCALAALVAGVMLWPRQGHGVSLARIKQHPEAFENQVVRVHGRVEEVFPLGQGWVYDLRQGKETITVFTRGTMPARHAKVEVVGQVSTGYLDGKPRVAILEGEQP
jgi:hypothetical protein